MAKKNSKRRYRREHRKNLQDYEEYERLKKEKRERKESNREARTLKQKVEERREQMQSTRRNLTKKSTNPVIRSKVKQDQLVEQFKQMKLDRLSRMNRGDAAMEANKQREDNISDDEEMRQEKVKNRKKSKAYQKMVKTALKRAAKRPILIRRKMEVD